MENKYLLFIILFLISGCKRPSPEPQASDAIYQSFKTELAGVESQLSEREGQLKEFESQVEQSDLESSELKVLRKKANMAAREVRKLQQGVKYWKLKLLSREEVVRVRYLAAFNRGEEWNNSDELEEFRKANERATRLQAKSKKGPAPGEQSKEASPPPEGGE